MSGYHKLRPWRAGNRLSGMRRNEMSLAAKAANSWTVTGNARHMGGRYGNKIHIPRSDEVVAEYPLQVYLDLDDFVLPDPPITVIKVRSGRGVWVQGYPAELVTVADPASGYTPVELPETGFTIVAVKLTVPHSSDVATWAIYTAADETPDTVYGKTTSGVDTMERYWPLAKVDSDGEVTSYWPGGDILAMRSG